MFVFVFVFVFSFLALLASQVSAMEGKHPDDHSGHVQGLAECLLLMAQVHILLWKFGQIRRKLTLMLVFRIALSLGGSESV